MAAPAETASIAPTAVRIHMLAIIARTCPEAFENTRHSGNFNARKERRPRSRCGFVLTRTIC
jgi:hypothetical protein